MDFRNLDALRVECELARRLGYVGKVAIHPAQVAVINDVFTPAPDVVAYQRNVLEAFERAEAAGSASIAVDGRMVEQRRDTPLEHRPAADQAQLLHDPGADALPMTARGHDSGGTQAAVLKLQWHGGVTTVRANGPPPL